MSELVTVATPNGGESDYELPGYIVDALFTLDVVIARAKKRVDKGEGEGEVKPEDVPLTAEDIKNISRKIHTATKTAHAKINEIDPTGPEIKEFQAGGGFDWKNWKKWSVVFLAIANSMLTDQQDETLNTTFGAIKETVVNMATTVGGEKIKVTVDNLVNNKFTCESLTDQHKIGDRSDKLASVSETALSKLPEQPDSKGLVLGPALQLLGTDFELNLECAISTIVDAAKEDAKTAAKKAAEITTDIVPTITPPDIFKIIASVFVMSAEDAVNQAVSNAEHLVGQATDRIRIEQNELSNLISKINMMTKDIVMSVANAQYSIKVLSNVKYFLYILSMALVRNIIKEEKSTTSLAIPGTISRYSLEGIEAASIVQIINMIVLPIFKAMMEASKNSNSVGGRKKHSRKTKKRKKSKKAKKSKKKRK